MPGRSLKGHVAHISTGFLRILNMIMAAGGAAIIIIIFILENSPSFPAGWGFIALGIFVILSGIFGAISSGQGGCFGCHMFNLVVSASGLCASFLVIFLKLNSVYQEMSPKVRKGQAKRLLRIEGAICFILFCTQMVILLLACLIHKCGFIDYYEDLEVLTAQPSNAKELARLHAEESLQRERRESSSASKLAERMRKKYGQWSYDSSGDHFDTESQASSRL